MIVEGEIKKRQSKREEAMEKNAINPEHLELCHAGANASLHPTLRLRP